jgi:hypothetical protein
MYQRIGPDAVIIIFQVRVSTIKDTVEKYYPLPYNQQCPNQHKQPAPIYNIYVGMYLLWALDEHRKQWTALLYF